MPSESGISIRSVTEAIGRKTVRSVEEFGYVFTLFLESIYWLVLGWRRQQPVRPASIAAEARAIGVQAVPITSVLCLAVGAMLGIQGIATLERFGAESQVIMGIALSITREFSPLIVSILVAGRSGSAVTARIGYMVESEEIDALRVLGISPVRYLASPILAAMLLMVPALTVLGDLMGIMGGALYAHWDLNMSLTVYLQRTMEVLALDDIRQGLVKSLVFSAIIGLTAISNGFQVRGGAVGVGLATTRSVVLSISLIVLADMIFTYVLNR